MAFAVGCSVQGHGGRCFKCNHGAEIKRSRVRAREVFTFIILYYILSRPESSDLVDSTILQVRSQALDLYVLVLITQRKMS